MNALTTLRPARDALYYNDSALAAERVAVSPDVALTPKQRAKKLAAHCAKFTGADSRQGVIQILNTGLPFVALIAAMLAGVHAGFWPALLLSIPAGGLLVRLFIIQHDCGHGSFLQSQRANDIVGILISVLTLAPYGFWRRAHAYHHASSGHLDKRGIGDINTLTVAEYEKLSGLGQFQYRIYRHPLFLFGFGVPLYFTVIQRLPFWQPYAAREIWPSILGLNAMMVALYGSLIWLIGAKTVLLVALPVVIIASAAGGWLFFVQHQFEETLWDKAPDWDFQVAAVLGSSYYVMPKPLQWITGNIGLHHIHHLCSKIPNYRLQACLDASPELTGMNRLTLVESLKCAHLALWCEQRRRMVTFREVNVAAA
jgi:acyl-lipid omega-6 desaturase (Delta-12 desaturase)